MTETVKNENGGWGAGVGGAIGAVLGSNGLFGGNGGRDPAVTPDQLNSALNGLQGQIQRDALQTQISGSTQDVTNTINGGTAVTGLGLAGVKDAVTHASHHNSLALCGLGHQMSAGFAGLTSTVQAGFASAERLALQQALDAERVRATEMRIQLSEAKNSAGHASTQVLLNQVINAGKA